MARFSYTCCLFILFYAFVLGEVKPEMAAMVPDHVTCVYTYGCTRNEAECTQGCREMFHGFNQGCAFSLGRACPCACFCMTHRKTIEDCHYRKPPISADAIFSIDPNTYIGV